MSVAEDVAALQAGKTQGQTAEANKKIIDAIKKRNAALVKRQTEAKRKLAEKQVIYNQYIAQLASGKSKGKTLSEETLNRIRAAAEELNKEFTDLRRIIAQKPEVIKLPTVSLTSKTTTGPTGTVAAKPTATQQTKTPTGNIPAPNKTPSGKIPPKAPKPKPITPSGEAISEGFDVAAVRAGEEASMGATPAVPSATQRKFADILKDTEFWYDLPDYIFKLDVDPTTGEPGELGKILVQAVNEGWDDDKFLSKIRLTKWWQSNAKPIRERIISRAKFNELQASGQDTSKTEFALDSAAIKRNVQARARAMGANLDENAINQVVSRIYDGFLENDTVAIDSFIAPYIGKTSSILGTMGLGVQPKGYTGQALQNYQALQAVAKANGFSINDILPRLSVMPGQSLDDVVLQKLATGELDINRLAQDARILAAQGQPDYVKGLLQQGYDLEQIYAPYKNVMANILEVNADEIDLNDATLRSAIGQDREMNLFDFKKALRKDSRWQYTEGAREEVANSVLGVLRDFGFQG